MWRIGLEKSKETLKETTLDFIRLALLPLTMRYRTDLISQLLRRISCTFYTDTIFSKQKYIIGNTCNKIFTDGEGFIYVNPMLSKSQAVKYLNVVIRDIGIPNTLISDNAGDQKVSQT